MSAHTPTQGPWTYTGMHSREGHEFRVHQRFHRQDCPEPKRIATLWNIYEDEGRANARLIAAAPDLYEALKAMLTFFAPAPGQGVSIDAVMRAEWAIAKVEGR